jgi:predicted deacylase
MTDNQFRINNQLIAPGTKEWVTIAEGKLPIGQKVQVKALVYNAPLPGPRVLLMAGMHGDEINSVEIIRRTTQSGMLDQLLCGTVIAISLVNIFGFLNFSRDLPDGKDVNRSFPGSAVGSLAARLAYGLSHNILPMIDLGVDFHTGSAMKYNYPHIRFNKGDLVSKKLAGIFNAPVAFAQPCIPKSLRKTAKDLKKPILVFEGGESMRLDDYALHIAQDGIQNLLIHHQMLKGNTTSKNELHFEHSSWLRASSAGIFHAIAKPGTFVRKGEIVGEINDPFQGKPIQIKSKKNGFIVGVNYAAIVNQGDALYHVAYDNIV